MRLLRMHKQQEPAPLTEDDQNPPADTRQGPQNSEPGFTIQTPTQSSFPAPVDPKRPIHSAKMTTTRSESVAPAIIQPSSATPAVALPLPTPQPEETVATPSSSHQDRQTGTSSQVQDGKPQTQTQTQTQTDTQDQKTPSSYHTEAYKYDQEAYDFALHEDATVAGKNGMPSDVDSEEFYRKKLRERDFKRMHHPEAPWVVGFDHENERLKDALE